VRVARAVLRAVLRVALAVLRPVLRVARAVLRAVLRAVRAVLRAVLRAVRAVLRPVVFFGAIGFFLSVSMSRNCLFRVRFIEERFTRCRICRRTTQVKRELSFTPLFGANPSRFNWRPFCYDSEVMDPLHATIEEFAAEGYTHIECHCPRFRMIRLRPISWLPRISMDLSRGAKMATLRRVIFFGLVLSAVVLLPPRIAAAFYVDCNPRPSAVQTHSTRCLYPVGSVWAVTAHQLLRHFLRLN